MILIAAGMFSTPQVSTPSAKVLMWVNKETIRAINKQSFLISNPCMINTEAKIILSFHFC